MYSAYILCVGNELLSGVTSERHGQYLAARLREYHVQTAEIRVVPDNTQKIAEAIREVPCNCLVVVTGGLGPTQDDLTRAAIAAAAGVTLKFDDEVWGDIQNRVGRSLSGSNRRQAYVPDGFTSLGNDWGTAPGLLGRISSKTVAALPGPPRELHAMVGEHLDRILRMAWVNITVDPAVSVSTCFGVPESELEDALIAAVEQHDLSHDVTWHTRAERMRIVFTLIGGQDHARDMVRDTIATEYGEDRIVADEVEIGEVVVRDLVAAGLVLAVAESCTGGLVGATVTETPGSSQVFWGSLVTYADDAKTMLLEVDDSLLEGAGSVSEECVRAMVAGLARRSSASLFVAISGIAGPSGGTRKKPIGTVWLATGLRGGEVITLRLSLSGDRDRIRRFATQEALLLLRRTIAA